jgi:3-methylcrotonyl-CoA carboxylase alpha subunit
MTTKNIQKVLIANRGEIALRIIRTLNKLGMEVVAIYAAPDAEALHVEMADEAYSLGDGNLANTYLDIAKIIRIAKKAKVDAIHPGYGFLSENPMLVKACEENNIAFIGPDARSMQLMGNKIAARKFAIENGLPVTKGLTGTPEEIVKAAGALPFPVLVKAAAGGGGKGMRVVNSESELEGILETTSREAKNYFGDGTVYIEQFIEEPRHIEVQVLGDQHGNVIHLFERECTIQRRYQKIIEESPSPTLTQQIRHEMGSAAVSLCKAIGYRSAGTIEFLVDKDLHFYFLEMNTRIQVEHPVTEMVTGIDLVEEQIKIAQGYVLEIKQEDVQQTGHAIECRIYAEDPSNNFMPSPGKLHMYLEPEHPNLRIDSSMEEATEVLSFYDPMISKLIAWGHDRDQALKLADEALGNYILLGIKTNITYLKQVLMHPLFVANKINTGFCDAYTAELTEAIEAEKKQISHPDLIAALLMHSLQKTYRIFTTNIWQEIGYWRHTMRFAINIDDSEYQAEVLHFDSQQLHLRVDGKEMQLQLIDSDSKSITVDLGEQVMRVFVSEDEAGQIFGSYDGHAFSFRRMDLLSSYDSHENKASTDEAGSLFASMPGKVIKVNVKAGEKVKRGTVLLVVEAMKMENNIVAQTLSLVEEIKVKAGDMVDTKTQLIHLSEIE